MAEKKGKRGGVRPGAGPKPKPIEERRRNRLVLNLKDRELEAIERAAGERPAADFARDVVLRYVARRRAS
ncbi:MAG TPA: hypothetical protein VKM54_04950 [Myxococcota bacterium]|nr:hypothetical protein [Myxococcota bacterium]